MLSAGDAEKMLAQLEAISAELGSVKARIRVMEAELSRLREKLA